MTRRTSLLVGATVAAALTVLGLAVPATARTAHPSVPSLSWRDTATGSTARFRGLAVVSRNVAWAGGYDGTVLRTTDGGRTWTSVGPAGAELLQFRDIEASSAAHAVVMSAGPGEESRIYVTDDGGATWDEADRMSDPAGFYDCMAFTDRRRGVVISDPVGGVLTLKATRDGGHTWTTVDPSAFPLPQAGEYYFAGSGTCLSAGVGRNLYLGTGGAATSRVYASHDGGRSWTTAQTPIASGESSGIFSVRFLSSRHGIAVGGDYLAPENTDAVAAWSRDGGRTWQLSVEPTGGYRSGAAFAPVAGAGIVAIAVGPTGSDVSFDGGRTWRPIDGSSLDTVQCVAGRCWAAGENGRIAILEVGRH